MSDPFDVRPDARPTDAQLAAIDAAVDAGRDARTELLRELVRFASTLGREHAVQARVADAFAAAGLAVETIPLDYADLATRPGFSPVDWPEDGREVVVGRHVVNEAAGRSLLLNAHVDVVPTGPEHLWRHPPFGAVVEDGRMYGRGAGDMKAGLAAMLHAVTALHDAGLEPASTVVLQSVVEEECTGNGALAAVLAGDVCDAAIIPEPFDRTILTAQLGVLWARVTVEGRPTHVLEATAGVDAIRLAGEIAESFRDLEARMNAPEERPAAYADAPHPINVNVGRIEGGEWTSSVPASCTFDVRFGFFPGTSVADMKARVEAHLARFVEAHPVLKDAPPRLAYVGFQAEPYEPPADHPAWRGLAEVHAAFAGAPPATLASTATTDARILGLVGGTPTTCYGPTAGSIHGVDEWVDLDSVHEVTRTLAHFLARWTGVRPRGGA